MTTLSVIRLEPTRGLVRLRLGEVWQYRELLLFLAARDVRLRYRQTVLGAAWVLLQPLVTMAIFAVVFGRLAKLPSEGVAYAPFALAALVPWVFFSTSLSTASLSLVSNVNLVTKVWFPRLCIPIAAVLASVVDLVVSLAALVPVFLWYGVEPPPARLLLLPLLGVLVVAASLGVSLWLSAVNIVYRDVRFVLPFLVQFWLFATPVAYSATLVDARWRPLCSLNPAWGVVEGFRWALLGQSRGVTGEVLVSLLSTVALLVSGAYWFRRSERQFADVA